MSHFDETLSSERRRVLRAALFGGAAAIGAIAASRLRPRMHSALSPAVATKAGDVLLACYADDGRYLGLRRVPRLVLDDAQWRRRLSAAAFDVMRRDGTEIAYSGPHEKPSRPGLYRCAGCATALFDAAAQFDSGTGWPSFWQPIAAQNVLEREDDSFGWRRTAVSCTGCDSHLGHVFDDGPRPTGLRYCMNSVALRFVARG